MPIVTTIAGLSQTAASNGPDGSVDPPSSLDDQDRYHGSFIAMLRDGVGFTAGAIPIALGFTPVRQGGQSSGGTNVVSLGWNAGLGKLVMAVDGNQFSNRWPIDVTGQAGSVLGLNGTNFTFSWTDPGGGAGQYVLAGDSPGTMFVRPQAALSVAYAANSGACSGNAATAGTASNSNMVNGIGGWSYTNNGNNPAYIWCTEGNGQSQHLTTPASLNVNYANSAGSAPANGGTADNSNALGGQGVAYFINGGGSAVRNLRNNGVIQMLAGVAAIGDMYWGANVSDKRLKKDINDTQADSLGAISRIRFVGYRFRGKTDGLDFDVDDGHFHPVGIVAQEVELQEPEWITSIGTWKQPDQYAMLCSALHAIQQLNEQVRELKRKMVKA